MMMRIITGIALIVLVPGLCACSDDESAEAINSGSVTVGGVTGGVLDAVPEEDDICSSVGDEIQLNDDENGNSLPQAEVDDEGATDIEDELEVEEEVAVEEETLEDDAEEDADLSPDTDTEIDEDVDEETCSCRMKPVRPDAEVVFSGSITMGKQHTRQIKLATVFADRKRHGRGGLLLKIWLKDGFPQVLARDLEGGHMRKLNSDVPVPLEREFQLEVACDGEAVMIFVDGELHAELVVD